MKIGKYKQLAYQHKTTATTKSAYEYNRKMSMIWKDSHLESYSYKLDVSTDEN